MGGRGSTLQVERRWALLAVNLAAAVEFFTIPLFGLLSDHFTRRRTYVVGCLFLAAFAFYLPFQRARRHRLIRMFRQAPSIPRDLKVQLEEGCPPSDAPGRLQTLA